MNREQARIASTVNTLLNVSARIQSATKNGYFHTGIHVSERTVDAVVAYLTDSNFTFEKHSPRGNEVFFHISW